MVVTGDVAMGDATMRTTQRRRPELASFLRSRRARVTPADVGMPPGLRRRTPGLRREEVAQLSGVGVTWYTWLEQGRPINASAQVLDAVARTLRLDPPEREHLYRLAQVPFAPDPEGLTFRERELPVMVATLRSSYGRHVGEPAWEGFISALAAASPYFAELWASGEVVQPGPRVKTFRHKAVGELRMTSQSLSIDGMPECRIVVYTPEDAETREKSRLLRETGSSSTDL